MLFLDTDIGVQSLEFSVQEDIVRGYDTILAFNFTIMNFNNSMQVSVVTWPSQNYHIALYFSDTDSPYNLSSWSQGLVPINMSKDILTRGMLPMERLEISGEADTAVPREQCFNIAYLCANVEPANGSSYSLAEAFRSQVCIDITLQLNCEGDSISHVVNTGVYLHYV